MYYILLVKAFNKACDKCFTSIFCFEVRIFSLSLAISANKRARKNLTCQVNLWSNSTPFCPLTLVFRSTNREVRSFSLSLAISANKRARRCVICLGQCSLDSPQQLLITWVDLVLSTLPQPPLRPPLWTSWTASPWPRCPRPQ